MKMPREIGEIKTNGFTCTIYEDSGGRVFFTAGASIDADGANGQNGRPVAYMADDLGTEALANGGMKIEKGRVICAKNWARDIVILGNDSEPRIFTGGLIASKTWYKHPEKASDDPSAYIDSETVAYIAVPPIIINKTSGIVCGCKARATFNGTSIDCVVADQGPANKIGELSIAAARALNISSSPRDGGLIEPQVLYEIWPGTAAPGFKLQPA